ncbi:DHH family phosphoesterase [bacterium]
MKIIITHAHYDFDALASALCAKKLFPNAAILLSKKSEKSTKDFLKKFPDILDYKIIEDQKNKRLQNLTKLVLVDTTTIDRNAHFIYQYITDKTEIIIFDHHTDSPILLNTTKTYLKKQGSTTSIILEKIFKKPSITFTKNEILLLMLGIYEDTGMLKYPSTTKNDIQTIQKLKKITKIPKAILEKYVCINLNQKQKTILENLQQNQEVISLGDKTIAFSYVKLKSELQELSSIVHCYRDCNNFTACFVFFEHREKIFVISRSQHKMFPIIDTIHHFGGGGHKTAGSTIVRNWNLFDLISELKKHYLNKVVANINLEYFNFPVIKVRTKLPVKLNLSEKLFITKINNKFTLFSKNELEYLKLHKIKISLDLLPNKTKVLSSNNTFHNAYQYIYNKNLHNPFIVKNSKKNTYHLLLQKDVYKVIGEQVKFYGKINLDKALHGVFNKRIINILKHISMIAESEHFSPYLVGGPVRDILLQNPVFDLDIVIDKGDGIEFAKKLAKKINADLKIFPRFRTAKLTIDSKIEIDIATTRIETYPFPGSLPEIQEGNIMTDLKRRDFTINAMAIALSKKHYGCIVDPFGGRSDLVNKKVEVLHNLSFLDDPTRIYRALRFATRFGFTYKTHTKKLLYNALDNNIQKTISPKRLKNEIEILFGEINILKIIKTMDKYKILKHIHNKIELTPKIIKYLHKINHIIFISYIYISEHTYNLWLIYLLIICEDLSVKEREKVSHELVLTKNEKKFFIKAKSISKSIVEKLSKKNLTPSEIYSIASTIQIEILIYAASLTDNTTYLKNIFSYITKYKSIKVHIDGHALKKLGIEQGKIFKKILREILHNKIDGKIITKQDEISYVIDKYLKN